MLCGTVPATNAPGCTAAEGLLVLVLPTCTARCLHQSERKNYLGEKWPVISTESYDFHAYTIGFFYMPQICDMGQRALLRFRRKNPTASAGFEPANLGTKGQHATSRPPKPLMVYILTTKL